MTPHHPVIVGHRGAAAVTPENTVTSFRRGGAQGSRWLECDGDLSADGQDEIIPAVPLEGWDCAPGSRRPPAPPLEENETIPPHRPVIVGHRGAAAVTPENTVTSFRRGVAEGSRWLECDVHLSADGQDAIIHDAT